jgi:hypothetical protein
LIYFFDGGVSGPPLITNLMFLSGFPGADASTTITDESNRSVVFTANGNAQIDTSQSMFGGTSLQILSGGGSISTPNATWNDLESRDSTVEGFFRLDAISSRQILCGKSNVGASSVTWIEVSAGNKLQYLAGTFPGGLTMTSTTSVTATTWTHFAVTIQYNGVNYTRRLFLAGNLEATATGAAIGNVSSQFCFGKAGLFGSLGMNGRLDECAIWHECRYTASFTPPASPLARP